ncbi:methyltransferase-domain-containing protein [Cercophora newfieldiana]|uniref:Ribosomal RNA-processing protein 8 n=1 Tax=Cercophora newfieldiana TaxID=92897 RepID=A0AA39Y095_9PEZI|nr:methyltransferase-domain-containing protein [Cercophora newfieldiana]
MFSVKGWSVSADKLKVETADGRAIPAADAAAKPKDPNSESAPTKNKKRKRPGNPQGAQNVTAANFADMWERVIEQKDASAGGEKPPSRKEKKLAKKAQRDAVVEEKGEAQPESKPEQQQKQKKEKKEKKEEPKSQPEKQGKKDKKMKNKDTVPDAQPHAADAEEEEWGGFDEDIETSPKAAQSTESGEPEKERKRKKQKTDKGPRSEVEGASPKTNGKQSDTSKAPAPPAPPAPPAVKLTPLQASMREKLVSARFRHLNETLYTRPSTDAFQLFEESPEMFTEYHEGFRRQVDVWPENPVDGYIGDIEARAKVRFPPKNVRHDFANPIASIRLLPLPRHTRSGLCTIADLGCGDAALATRLQPRFKKLQIDIKSFDLQTGGSPLVTRADIANLPLADGSVDVAVFCLALMGTNWTDFVEEAYRILRWKGELWIAEIKSRFTNPSAGKKQKVVSHSVGNRRNPMPAPGTIAAAAAATSKKSKKSREAAEAAAEADEAELAIAVDGAELRRQETDISAFVDALRARGFLLHKEMGAGAVDLNNKMFVKMHFVKVAPATKGKYAEKPRPNVDRMGATGPARKGKFINDDEDGFDEAAILKPCVYKQR